MKLNANTSCGQLLFYAPSWLDACCFSEIPHFGTPLIHSMQAHFWETFAKQSEVRSCETPLKNKNDGHSCHGTFLRHASEALLWDSRLRRFGKTIVGGTFLRHSLKRLRWKTDLRITLQYLATSSRNLPRNHLPETAFTHWVSPLPRPSEMTISGTFPGPSGSHRSRYWSNGPLRSI